MSHAKFLSVFLCCAMLLSTAGCSLFSSQQPTESVHAHSFGEWVAESNATCTQKGREDRSCAVCGFIETRTIAQTAHRQDAYSICRDCGYVEIDQDSPFVELGVSCGERYGKKTTPKFPWDIKIWNGKVYRGAGDYDKNSGVTPIYAYDITTSCWHLEAFADDESIQRFIEIDGMLFAPGVDSTGSWTYGNYYYMEGDTWKGRDNLPNGIHCFDMIGFDGKLFAGLGTGITRNAVFVSADNGKNWTVVPLREDENFDSRDYNSSRAYEFIVYNNELYAYISLEMGFGSMKGLFRYENGEMVFLRNGYDLAGGISNGRNYWDGKFEFGGKCYLTAGSLFAITDFSDMEAARKVDMPKKEFVSDALVKDGVIYALCYREIRDAQTHMRNGYTTTIYKSTTGEPDSFTEVLSFDYACMPLAFDFDGEHFYIGMGLAEDGNDEKTGMVLRVKPNM